MKNITSHSEFLSMVPGTGKSCLLLYKPDSEISQCAYNNLARIVSHDLSIFVADVSMVRDIHGTYGISTVPALLLFDDGAFTNVIKGCHETSFYEAVISSDFFVAAGLSEDIAAKRVTVYSTPSCSWCNTLKTWLNKYNVKYTDIDISRDERAAEALVRRSGQQGVPQTDINGQIVVGFNQPMLKQLLEIN